MYIYIHTHIYIYSYIYIYIFIYLYIYMFTYLNIVDCYSIDVRLIVYIFLTHCRTTVCVNRILIAWNPYTTTCKLYVNRI